MLCKNCSLQDFHPCKKSVVSKEGQRTEKMAGRPLLVHIQAALLARVSLTLHLSLALLHTPVSITWLLSHATMLSQHCKYNQGGFHRSRKRTKQSICTKSITDLTSALHFKAELYKYWSFTNCTISLLITTPHDLHIII